MSTTHSCTSKSKVTSPEGRTQYLCHSTLSSYISHLDPASSSLKSITSNLQLTFNLQFSDHYMEQPATNW